MQKGWEGCLPASFMQPQTPAERGRPGLASPGVIPQTCQDLSLRSFCGVFGLGDCSLFLAPVSLCPAGIPSLLKRTSGFFCRK